MKQYSQGRGWTTVDEMISIDYMAGGSPRKNGLSSLEDAEKRLETYVKTVSKRVWDAGDYVNVNIVKNYAIRAWQEVQQKRKIIEKS